MSDVVIIGGGAAGMMAAVAAAVNGHRVRICEKNEKLGKKLYITGKGRCNLTNACETDELFGHVIHNPKFLYSSFYGFTNRDMMAFMEANGCPVKVERGNRVFPVSDKSSDVIRALSRRLEELGVEVLLHTEVSEIVTGEPVPPRDGGRLLREMEAGAPESAGEGDGEPERAGSKSDELPRVRGIRLRASGRFIPADAVIVATGGLSYPSTGSTGDGYEMARRLGHRVTELRPGLVPFIVAEAEEARQMQGLALRNIRARVLSGKRVLYEEFGEMLFTHFGVSGPVLLSASSYSAAALKKGPLTLSLDLKPALTEEQLDSRLLRDFSEQKNRQYRNSLGGLLPARMIPSVVARSGIEPEKQVNEITRQERRQLIRVLKDYRMTLTGLRGYNEAVITQGGVAVGQVNPSTMESRLVRGLYFVGEVLDLDAVTGGFNLQIAWSTGYLAGQSVPGN